jgi:recombination protein RecA
MAAPFKQAEFDIIYGVGISREGSLLDFGVEKEIVKKSGAWYTYEGEQLGQGKENSRKYLIDNPKVADEIEKKIKTKLGIGVPRAVADLPIDEVAEATSSSVEEVAPVAVSKAADAKVSAAVTKAAASA